MIIESRSLPASLSFSGAFKYWIYIVERRYKKRFKGRYGSYSEPYYQITEVTKLRRMDKILYHILVDNHEAKQNFRNMLTAPVPSFFKKLTDVLPRASGSVMRMRRYKEG